MFIQNCMLVMLALTLDNEESLLNLEIKSRKHKVAAVCFVAFLLGMFFKVFYYYCLHPWPIFGNAVCRNMSETLKHLTIEQETLLGNVLSMLTFVCFSGLVTSIYLIFTYMSFNQSGIHRKTMPSHHSTLLILTSVGSAIFLVGILFNGARPKGVQPQSVRPRKNRLEEDLEERLNVL